MCDPISQQMSVASSFCTCVFQYNWQTELFPPNGVCQVDEEDVEALMYATA